MSSTEVIPKLRSETLEKIKELGKHIQSRQELLEQFVSECPAPICMIDDKMRVVLYSKRYLDEFKLNGCGDITGKHLFDNISSLSFSAREDLKYRLNELRAGERLITNGVFLGKNAAYRAAIRKFYLMNGGPSFGGWIIFCEAVSGEHGIEYTVENGDRIWKTEPTGT
jgi:hypothetical protein